MPALPFRAPSCRPWDRLALDSFEVRVVALVAVDASGGREGIRIPVMLLSRIAGLATPMASALDVGKDLLEALRPYVLVRELVAK
jgi:hypothetical protein